MSSFSFCNSCSRGAYFFCSAPILLWASAVPSTAALKFITAILEGVETAGTVGIELVLCARVVLIAQTTMNGSMKISGRFIANSFLHGSKGLPAAAGVDMKHRGGELQGRNERGMKWEVGTGYRRKREVKVKRPFLRLTVPFTTKQTGGILVSNERPVQPWIQMRSFPIANNRKRAQYSSLRNWRPTLNSLCISSRFLR